MTIVLTTYQVIALSTLFIAGLITLFWQCDVFYKMGKEHGKLEERGASEKIRRAHQISEVVLEGVQELLSKEVHLPPTVTVGDLFAAKHDLSFLSERRDWSPSAKARKLIDDLIAGQESKP